MTSTNVQQLFEQFMEDPEYIGKEELALAEAQHRVTQSINNHKALSMAKSISPIEALLEHLIKKSADDFVSQRGGQYAIHSPQGNKATNKEIFDHLKEELMHMGSSDLQSEGAENKLHHPTTNPEGARWEDVVADPTGYFQQGLETGQHSDSHRLLNKLRPGMPGLEEDPEPDTPDAFRYEVPKGQDAINELEARLAHLPENHPTRQLFDELKDGIKNYNGIQDQLDNTKQAPLQGMPVNEFDDEQAQAETDEESDVGFGERPFTPEGEERQHHDLETTPQMSFNHMLDNNHFIGESADGERLDAAHPKYGEFKDALGDVVKNRNEITSFDSQVWPPTITDARGILTHDGRVQAAPGNKLDDADKRKQMIQQYVESKATILNGGKGFDTPHEALKYLQEVADNPSRFLPSDSPYQGIHTGDGADQELQFIHNGSGPVGDRLRDRVKGEDTRTDSLAEIADIIENLTTDEGEHSTSFVEPERHGDMGGMHRIPFSPAQNTEISTIRHPDMPDASARSTFNTRIAQTFDRDKHPDHTALGQLISHIKEEGGFDSDQLTGAEAEQQMSAWVDSGEDKPQVTPLRQDVTSHRDMGMNQLVDSYLNGDMSKDDFLQMAHLGANSGRFSDEEAKTLARFDVSLHALNPKGEAYARSMDPGTEEYDYKEGGYFAERAPRQYDEEASWSDPDIPRESEGLTGEDVQGQAFDQERAKDLQEWRDEQEGYVDEPGEKENATAAERAIVGEFSDSSGVRATDSPLVYLDHAGTYDDDGNKKMDSRGRPVTPRYRLWDAPVPTLDADGQISAKDKQIIQNRFWNGKFKEDKKGNRVRDIAAPSVDPNMKAVQELAEFQHNIGEHISSSPSVPREQLGQSPTRPEDFHGSKGIRRPRSGNVYDHPNIIDGDKFEGEGELVLPNEEAVTDYEQYRDVMSNLINAGVPLDMITHAPGKDSEGAGERMWSREAMIRGMQNLGVLNYGEGGRSLRTKIVTNKSGKKSEVAAGYPPLFPGQDKADHPARLRREGHAVTRGIEGAKQGLEDDYKPGIEISPEAQTAITDAWAAAHPVQKTVGGIGKDIRGTGVGEDIKTTGLKGRKADREPARTPSTRTYKGAKSWKWLKRDGSEQEDDGSTIQDTGTGFKDSTYLDRIVRDAVTNKAESDGKNHDADFQNLVTNSSQLLRRRNYEIDGDGKATGKLREKPFVTPRPGIKNPDGSPRTEDNSLPEYIKSAMDAYNAANEGKVGFEPITEKSLIPDPDIIKPEKVGAPEHFTRSEGKVGKLTDDEVKESNRAHQLLRTILSTDFGTRTTVDSKGKDQTISSPSSHEGITARESMHESFNSFMGGRSGPATWDAVHEWASGEDMAHYFPEGVPHVSDLMGYTPSEAEEKRHEVLNPGAAKRRPEVVRDVQGQPVDRPTPQQTPSPKINNLDELQEFLNRPQINQSLSPDHQAVLDRLAQVFADRNEGEAIEGWPLQDQRMIEDLQTAAKGPQEALQNFVETVATPVVEASPEPVAEAPAVAAPSAQQALQTEVDRRALPAADVSERPALGAGQQPPASPPRPMPGQVESAPIPMPGEVPADAVQIERVDRMTPELARANSDKLYLFGDNEQRTGRGPQAGQAVIRDESNAHGIRTKASPSQHWTAEEHEANIAKVDEDFKEAIERARAEGKSIVIPRDGFGTGRAALGERSPETLAHINDRIQQLEDGDFSVADEAPAVEEVPQPQADREPRVSDPAGINVPDYNRRSDAIFAHAHFEDLQEIQNALGDSKASLENYHKRKPNDPSWYPSYAQLTGEREAPFKPHDDQPKAVQRLDEVKDAQGKVVYSQGRVDRAGNEVLMHGQRQQQEYLVDEHAKILKLYEKYGRHLTGQDLEDALEAEGLSDERTKVAGNQEGVKPGEHYGGIGEVVDGEFRVSPKELARLGYTRGIQALEDGGVVERRAVKMPNPAYVKGKRSTEDNANYEHVYGTRDYHFDKDGNPTGKPNADYRATHRKAKMYDGKSRNEDLNAAHAHVLENIRERLGLSKDEFAEKLQNGESIEDPDTPGGIIDLSKVLNTEDLSPEYDERYDPGADRWVDQETGEVMDDQDREYHDEEGNLRPEYRGEQPPAPAPAADDEVEDEEADLPDNPQDMDGMVDRGHESQAALIESLGLTDKPKQEWTQEERKNYADAALDYMKSRTKNDLAADYIDSMVKRLSGEQFDTRGREADVERYGEQIGVGKGRNPMFESGTILGKIDNLIAGLGSEHNLSIGEIAQWANNNGHLFGLTPFSTFRVGADGITKPGPAAKNYKADLVEGRADAQDRADLAKLNGFKYEGRWQEQYARDKTQSVKDRRQERIGRVIYNGVAHDHQYLGSRPNSTPEARERQEANLGEYQSEMHGNLHDLAQHMHDTGYHDGTADAETKSHIDGQLIKMANQISRQQHITPEEALKTLTSDKVHAGTNRSHHSEDDRAFTPERGWTDERHGALHEDAHEDDAHVGAAEAVEQPEAGETPTAPKTGEVIPRRAIGGDVEQPQEGRIIEGTSRLIEEQEVAEIISDDRQEDFKQLPPAEKSKITETYTENKGFLGMGELKGKLGNALNWMVDKVGNLGRPQLSGNDKKVEDFIKQHQINDIILGWREESLQLVKDNIANPTGTNLSTEEDLALVQNRVDEQKQKIEQHYKDNEEVRGLPEYHAYHEEHAEATEAGEITYAIPDAVGQSSEELPTSTVWTNRIDPPDPTAVKPSPRPKGVVAGALEEEQPEQLDNLDALKMTHDELLLRHKQIKTAIQDAQKIEAKSVEEKVAKNTKIKALQREQNEVATQGREQRAKIAAHPGSTSAAPEPEPEPDASLSDSMQDFLNSDEYQNADNQAEALQEWANNQGEPPAPPTTPPASGTGTPPPADGDSDDLSPDHPLHWGKWAHNVPAEMHGAVMDAIETLRENGASDKSIGRLLRRKNFKAILKKADDIDIQGMFHEDKGDEGPALREEHLNTIKKLQKDMGRSMPDAYYEGMTEAELKTELNGVRKAFKDHQEGLHREAHQQVMNSLPRSLEEQHQETLKADPQATISPLDATKQMRQLLLHHNNLAKRGIRATDKTYAAHHEEVKKLMREARDHGADMDRLNKEVEQYGKNKPLENEYGSEEHLTEADAADKMIETHGQEYKGIFHPGSDKVINAYNDPHYHPNAIHRMGDDGTHESTVFSQFMGKYDKKTGAAIHEEVTHAAGSQPEAGLRHNGSASDIHDLPPHILGLTSEQNTEYHKLHQDIQDHVAEHGDDSETEEGKAAQAAISSRIRSLNSSLKESGHSEEGESPLSHNHFGADAEKMQDDQGGLDRPPPGKVAPVSKVDGKMMHWMPGVGWIREETFRNVQAGVGGGDAMFHPGGANSLVGDDDGNAVDKGMLIDQNGGHAVGTPSAQNPNPTHGSMGPIDNQHIRETDMADGLDSITGNATGEAHPNVTANADGSFHIKDAANTMNAGGSNYGHSDAAQRAATNATGPKQQKAPSAGGGGSALGRFKSGVKGMGDAAARQWGEAEGYSPQAVKQQTVGKIARRSISSLAGNIPGIGSNSKIVSSMTGMTPGEANLEHQESLEKLLKFVKSQQ